MRKILIISPHFPPSNLAAVHRSRLFAQHLSEFGWEPVILTVNEKYYEEVLDNNLAELVPPYIRIEKTAAFKTTKPRLIGDIGLRGFFQLYRRAKQLIKKEKFDFVYIPIPSFYTALLGRWLHSSTGVKYGIDYIDPWVHTFAGSEKKFSRHWWSTKISELLEPIAVKKASLITGVAEGYYKDVFIRNPHLKAQAISAAMPYGGERLDHEAIGKLSLKPYLFKKKPGKVQLIYAGAMLPKAYGLMEAIFESMTQNRTLFSQLEIHFIGTGKSPNDSNGYNIKPYAEKAELWMKQVFEYPKRIPYLDVLAHLEAATGAFILGSSDPHYTPSKVYQAVLSKKAVFAVLHTESSACKVIRGSGAGVVLDFNGEAGIPEVKNTFSRYYLSYLSFLNHFDYKNVNQQDFEKFSAKEVTRLLANALNKV